MARFVAKEMSVIVKPVSLLTSASATRGKRVRAVGTGRSPKSATKEKDKHALVFGAGGEICSERNERNSEPSEFTHKGERHSRKASSCRWHWA